MIFHSLDFIVFFAVTTLIYWRLPTRGQNAFIVVISYFFYGYVHPWFVTLIAATTVADYWAARGIERFPSRRRAMLWISVSVNLGLLAGFKYFGFFVDNVHAVLALAGLDVPRPALAVVLPVGISFYTFQELSYTIDVYRGRLPACRSLVDFAAFVCFYPQLVAGPIERATHLLPQVQNARTWSWPAAERALGLILWGYVKKLVIADNAGLIANKVFALESPGFVVLWAGVFAFAIQIYADFSAYSDIARGVARWLGFDLMVNFDHPYFATGPADFWRRWHISLSSWFRDYVYIPLGGSRAGGWRTAQNVMATFLLSGFWHGASWNYVLWGGYHGVLVLLARLSTSRPRPGPRTLADLPQVAGMFGLTCVGWLLFRETELQVLVRDLSLSPWDSSAADRELGAYLFLSALLYSVPLWIHGFWAVYVRPRLPESPFRGAPEPVYSVGRTLLAGVGLTALLVLHSRQSLDFIYFQF